MTAASPSVIPVMGLPGRSSETPFWDPSDASLNWVEIDAGTLHSWSPVTGRSRSVHLGSPLGVAVPRRRPGHIAGVGAEVVLTGPDGVPEWRWALPAATPDVRFNDGRCDGSGAFWTGTMSTSLEPGSGSLVRVDPAGTVAVVLDGIGLSNGLDWSPDGTTMYFVDSLSGAIQAFSCDAGTLQLIRQFARIENDRSVRIGMTVPDGLTVDADGCVWVAVFGAGEVRRYAPDGNLMLRIKVPSDVPTSCCFGGVDLADLYITTGGAGADGVHVFRSRPGVRGCPVRPYAG